MALVGEVEQPGEVEAQLWHILEEEQYQSHTTQTAEGIKMEAAGQRRWNENIIDQLVQISRLKSLPKAKWSH